MINYPVGPARHLRLRLPDGPHSASSHRSSMESPLPNPTVAELQPETNWWSRRGGVAKCCNSPCPW